VKPDASASEPVGAIGGLLHLAQPVQGLLERMTEDGHGHDQLPEVREGELSRLLGPDPEVALVDATGLVQTLAYSGEAAIMARFAGQTRTWMSSSSSARPALPSSPSAPAGGMAT